MPVGVFLFLKFFGRNEFVVAPLFEKDLPVGAAACGVTALPYRVAAGVLDSLHIPGGDSLALVLFGTATTDEQMQLRRMKEEVTVPVYQYTVADTAAYHAQWKRCVFLLEEDQSLALVDTQGRLRGQYTLSDREDADQLITELMIILKQY